MTAGSVRRLDFADPGNPNQFTAKSFKGGSNEYPVDIKIGSDGGLFFLARGTNSVERIAYSPTP